MDALTLIQAPDPLIKIGDAKGFLRVTDDAEDALILDLIETATAFLDGESGMLGRALGRQRWRLSLESFPRDGIFLPLPPLASVDLIHYRTPGGTVEPLPRAKYRVAIPGAAPAVIRAADRWPETARQEDAVTIEFTAGYDTVPKPILTAIHQHVATLYENRESSAYGSGTFKSVPFGGWDLVAAYARPFVG